jgi:glycosyltransferase involved in cell wall biosynthesis
MCAAACLSFHAGFPPKSFILGCVTLSVAIITKNEEANIRRTLESVRWADEVILVDSGSTDRTCEIARELGAKVFIEDWKGFAAQKNSAIEKCTGDWVLSLDADEEVTPELAQEIRNQSNLKLHTAFWINRRNLFLGRWIKHGGFYPDPKLRLFAKGSGTFADRAVHEDIELKPGVNAEHTLSGDLIHHAYPTLTSYIDHMNSYSSLAADMAIAKGQTGFSFLNIVGRPIATFIYSYFLRLGFLDGREGLLLHLYHSVYVSWKYAKAWEKSRK